MTDNLTGKGKDTNNCYTILMYVPCILYSLLASAFAGLDNKLIHNFNPNT
jgi:hypothetical protein